MLVATIPKLTDDHGTVCPLPSHLVAKDTDALVCRLISLIVSLTMPNLQNPTSGNLLPVLTKLASMLSMLEKLVVKSVLPKGGLPLDRRYVIISFDLTLF